ncbi:hypothetical protein ACFV1L_10555 [Kitasatospora sp. NPDC059646]|uniref:hypothetical protein n=1 Tax=Kitasatospora sp. NPDC059646 TaxID=3346893 RepID=UPI003698BBAE
MPIFLAGLILGGVSGGGTYLLTADGSLSAVVAGCVALATWLGIACVIFIDD